MAVYERKILVPYLYNVCCLEMLCCKLEDNVAKQKRIVREQEQYVRNLENQSEPQEPNRSDYERDFSATRNCVIIAVVALVVGGVLSADSTYFEGIIMTFFALIAGFCLMLAFANVPKERSDEYNQAYAQYERDKRAYEEAINGIDIVKEDVKNEQIKAWNLEKQLKEAKRIRTELYGINIIPSTYRNVHVAYYLYDYFNTSQETDLDKIIQTMLLDEIVKKVEKIIAKVDDVILYQRRQIALQEESNKILSDSNREQMKALARISENQRMETEYLQMIEHDIRVNNYFTMLDYFR